VELAVKEVKPENANKGLMEAITDKRWKYTGPVESKNDKWPGYDDMGQRYWDLYFLNQIRTCGCSVEKKQFVYSVFKYLYMKERHNKAIAYISLKYPCLSNMTIGDYSPWANVVYGGYGYTTVFTGRVFYGDAAFDSENIMASTISHENEHVKQPSSLRFIAGLDRSNYMLRVRLKLYPEPWNTPSEPPLYGFYWGAMEWPAYQKEIDLQYQTGAYHDSNGGYIDEQEDAMKFFKWLMENARNRR